jgi:hypothetical protein
MADIQTIYYTQAAQRAYSRAAAPNMKDMQLPLRFAKFDITLTGITANDNYILGQLGQDATIIPNLSFLVGVSGASDSVFKLESVSAPAAAPTALSGNVTLATDGTAVVLGAATGSTTGFQQIDKDAFLQLTLITANAAQAGDVVKLIVAYLPNDDSVN